MFYWRLACFALILMTHSLLNARDPHSAARPEEVKVTHLNLSLNVNFTETSLEGVAEWTLEKNHSNAPLWLDSRGLILKSITDPASGNTLKYTLHPEQEWLGSALEIHLPPETQKVRIEYTAPSGAPALQWLNPEQTLGKKSAFLFSQSQAILARTWIPIQDSPGIRFTFEATVQVPQGMLALMSAENPQQKSSDGKYHFRMKQPVPSYLMSLAAGDLEYTAVGRNTGVYAEPEALAGAVYEFSEMQAMLDAAEKLYGPYRWEQYDVLLLPPSFPFGGMENPRITFATPTILAGDRSLVSLIAHELAHSWSGNLVTNATWNDFWLNEGFTVYFERRIMEALHGPDYAKMLEVLGWQDVHHTIKDFGTDHPATCLKLKLDGHDPDDGMNDIAYEKGYFLLRTMEEAVGREKFDAFLNRHFSENAFTSLNTETFLEQLYSGLLTTDALKKQVNAERWIYQPGMPDNAPKVFSERFNKVDEVIPGIISGQLPPDDLTQNWSTHEWLHFLRHLPENINSDLMKMLDQKYHFTESGNSEIAAEWFLRAFHTEYTPAYAQAEKFMIRTGRRKFIVPLYKELQRTVQGKVFAKEIYKKARPNYHYVATATLDPDLL